MLFWSGCWIDRVCAGGSFAACGRRVTLPMAARRRKVHSTPFPPSGENCVRSLAPPLPGEPASLGFAGSNEGLGKTPPGTAPDEHFVLIVAFPRTPFTGVTPWVGQNISGAQNLSGVPPFNPGHWALGVQNLELLQFHNGAWVFSANAPGAFSPQGRPHVAARVSLSRT